jgi:hypothetical protein
MTASLSPLSPVTQLKKPVSVGLEEVLIKVVP